MNSDPWLCDGKQDTLSTEPYFQQLAATIQNLPCEKIDRIVAQIVQAFEEERTIFVFGNGGSAASASHMMCDMNKGTSSRHSRRLKVLALTDNVPLITAWANDCGYETVFSEQLKTFARPGDLVLAISGSGNSANVILALQTARDLGAVTVALTGPAGGRMKSLCDICTEVPCKNMQIVEDLHHAILHSMFAAVSQRIRFGNQNACAIGAGAMRR